MHAMTDARIRHLRRVRISNVFLIDGGRGDRWIIDTGHRVERAALASELRRSALAPSEITGLLLTHRHSDHAGNAAWLQRELGIKVYAHRADAEILDGTVPAPRMERGEGTFAAGLLARIENRWPARVRVDRALDDGDTVGSVEVHWTPGHTEGSVFYRHVETMALMSGDTLVTAIPPLVYRAGLALPYCTFTSDMQQALASIRAFHDRRVPYERLLPGHGRALMERADVRMREFLQSRRVIDA